MSAVLLSSAAGKVPLLRALQAAAARCSPTLRVVAGDVDPRALCRHVADDFWAMPRTEETALPTLLAGCAERGVRVVLPSRDGELGFWSHHAEQFRGVGIHVIVSPPHSIAACIDKQRFADEGAAAGLPVIPAFTTPDAVTRLWVVKERFGAGSRSIGLGLERGAALAHAAQLQAPVFQPFIDGTEISVDAWLDRAHRVKGLVLRRRDEVVNGESRVTTTFRDTALESCLAAALETLRLCGPVVMQVLIDDAGRPHIIECNARFGGASTAGLAAGLDSLYWSLREAQGTDVAALPFERRRDVRQVRVPHDMLFDDSRA